MINASAMVAPFETAVNKGVMVLMSDSRCLSVAEMSRITGVAEKFLSMCVKAGYLKPEVHACETMDFVGGQEAEAKQARAEGTPWVPNVRKVSAEENFVRFWRGPYGKQRLTDPRTIREMKNLSMGAPWDYQGAAYEREVEKLIANVFSTMRDDTELEQLTVEKILDAKESA